VTTSVHPVLLAAVAGDAGPTIVFIATILIVVALMGTVAWRASTGQRRPPPSRPDEPQQGDADGEARPAAPRDG
jgi:hypothetical protein